MPALEFLANDAPQRVFDLWRSPFDVLPESQINQGLISDRADGGGGLCQEVVDDVFINANGNPDFAGPLGLWWDDRDAFSWCKPPPAKLEARLPVLMRTTKLIGVSEMRVRLGRVAQQPTAGGDSAFAGAGRGSGSFGAHS